MLHTGCIHNTSKEARDEITASGGLAVCSPPSLQPAAKINSSETSFNFTVEKKEKKQWIILYETLTVNGGKCLNNSVGVRRSERTRWNRRRSEAGGQQTLKLYVWYAGILPGTAVHCSRLNSRSRTNAVTKGESEIKFRRCRKSNSQHVILYCSQWGNLFLRAARQPQQQWNRWSSRAPWRHWRWPSERPTGCKQDLGFLQPHCRSITAFFIYLFFVFLLKVNLRPRLQIYCNAHRVVFISCLLTGRIKPSSSCQTSSMVA